MERWLISFFLGAITALFLPFEPSGYYVIFFLALAITLAFLKSTRSTSGFFFAIFWLFYQGYSYQAINHQVMALLNHQFQTIYSRNVKPKNTDDETLMTNDWAKKSLTIAGNITTLMVATPPKKHQIASKMQKFNFKVSHINGEALNNSVLVRLSWKQPANVLTQGQRWQLEVKLKPAHGLANPSGFNYQTWLRYKQLHFTGYVKQSAANQLLGDRVSLRQQWYEQLHALMPQHALSSLVYALSFGERGELSDSIWQVLSATGTQHLVAISGLHIGLMTGLCFYFFRIVFQYTPWQRLFSTKRQQQLLQGNYHYLLIVLCCVFACFYSYLAGGAFTTYRAITMLAIYSVMRFLNIQLRPVNLLLLTIAFILVLMPMSMLSVSFWLSFYAVAIIFISYWRFLANAPAADKTEVLPDNTSKIRSLKITTTHLFLRLFSLIKPLVIIQLSLTFLLMPLVAFVNGQVSLTAFFANLLAVPWMSITTIPLCLLSVIALPVSEALSESLLTIALASLTFIWRWLSWLAAPSWSVIDVSNTQIWLLTFVIIVVCVLSLFKGFMTKASVIKKLWLVYSLPAFIVLSVYVGLHFKPVNNRQSAWFVATMDVGHGLAVVIERNNRVILYDTGASYPSGFNMAEAILLPYFQGKGIKQIDKVIISHKDNDHVGALGALLDNIPIQSLLMNNAEHLSLNVFNESLSPCLSGHHFSWQGLNFRVLWPIIITAKTSSNDSSCVIEVSDSKHRVLLTGDISKKVERQLIQKAQLNAVDVLIAPHHGSKSSSSLSFIHTLAPQHVVFSSAAYNRWQMPNKAVVNRYQTRPVNLYNTAHNGMIRFAFTEKGINVETFRNDIWPFWFAN